MDKKKLTIWSIVSLFVVCFAWVAFAAASIGSEASGVDKKMKDLLAAHADSGQVSTYLRDQGYDMSPPTTSEISATGPRHAATIYVTWLTLKVDFDATNKMSSYHLDRDSTWF